MLVARSFDAGSGADFEITEPQAHEADAKMRMTAPAGSTRSWPDLPDETRRATPSSPRVNPVMTRELGRLPPRAHSIPTIQIGATAISTAARPDGTRSSAQATLALPPSRRNPPIMVADR